MGILGRVKAVINKAGQKVTLAHFVGDVSEHVLYECFWMQTKNHDRKLDEVTLDEIFADDYLPEPHEVQEVFLEVMGYGSENTSYAIHLFNEDDTKNWCLVEFETDVKYHEAKAMSNIACGIWEAELLE